MDCLAHNNKTEKLQSLVVLKLKDLGTERNGFPSRETFDDLYALENKIEEIASNNGSKYPGRFITDGIGYYLVYSNSPEKVKAQLENLMNKVTKFSFDISVRDGNDWKDYYQMLYPPQKDKQRYHNSILINRIIQVGDKPDKERGIDHGVFFHTAEDREAYLKELKKLKFPYKSFQFFEDKDIDRAFTLELKVISPLKLDLLNSSTDILISLAEKYNAMYDGWGAEVIRE